MSELLHGFFFVQGFACMPAGICMSTMGRHASYDQAVAWKVHAEDNSVHCLAFSFINWSFIWPIAGFKPPLFFPTCWIQKQGYNQDKILRGKKNSVFFFFFLCTLQDHVWIIFIELVVTLVLRPKWFDLVKFCSY